MTSMQLQRHSAIGIAAAVAGALAIVGAETSVRSGLTKWTVALAATVVAGLGLGYAQYVVERDSVAERHLIFESPAANVGWWALWYALLFHAPARISVQGGPGLTDIGIVPGWLVVTAFVLVMVVSVALGGIHPSARPSYWRSEFRSGKRDALGDDG